MFVNKYIGGKLIPMNAKNENITKTFEENPKEKEFFSNLTHMKKINAYELELLANDPQKYDFMVVSCHHDLSVCSEGTK